MGDDVPECFKLYKSYPVCFSIDKIDFDKITGKKKVNTPKKWNELTIETCFLTPPYKAIGVLTGLKNNITVIDCDSNESYKKLTEQYPELLNTTIVKTPRGFHIYCKYNSWARTTTNKHTNIDVRNDGGFVYGCGSINVINQKYQLINQVENLVEMSDELVRQLCLHDAIPDNRGADATKRRKDNFIPIEIKGNCELSAYSGWIIENIDILYWTNYNDWIRIIWAIKNTFGNKGKELAKFYSSKCDNYEEQSFNEHWYRGKNGNSFGTLEYYSKISNEEQYKLIKFMNSDKYIETSDVLVCKNMLQILGDNFIKIKSGADGDECYLYNEDEKIWKIISKKEKDSLSNEITDQNENLTSIIKKKYKSALKEIQQKISFTDDEEEQKKLKVKYDEIVLDKKKLKTYETTLQSKSKLDSVCDLMIGRVKVSDDIEFDYNPFLLSFKNTTFNLETGKETVRTKYDYITSHTNYNWLEPTDDEMETIDKLVKEVLPDENTRKSYLSVLFSGLTKIQQIRFSIATGRGRNGKSVLNELMRDALGNSLSKQGDVLSITKELSTGSNVSVAHLDKKTFVVWSEPKSGESLRFENIKQFTGNKEFTARLNFSNKDTIKLCLTAIMEANTVPVIDEKIDINVIQRLLVFKFPNLFILDENDEPIPEENKYPQNKDLKEQPFRTKHRCALIKYLLLYAPKTIYIPKEVQETTKQYLNNCDTLFKFCEEEIKLADNEDSWIKVRDLFNKYKESVYYKKLKKNELTTWTEFVEKIKTHNIYGIHYKDKYQYKKNDGKMTTARNVLFKYEFIPDEEKGCLVKDDDDDDDDDEVEVDPTSC